MNITATNSTATTKVTDTIRVKYRISTRGTEAVKDITAEIVKDETTVSCAGIVDWLLWRGEQVFRAADDLAVLNGSIWLQ